ncbi:hypothetical protein RB195_017966 [Necator americanus]|uniref:Uncharacterized protein n=1 Tax=Necator americanus TaxID=51031 RepID=A0ABR1C7J8_NECAM
MINEVSSSGCSSKTNKEASKEAETKRLRAYEYPPKLHLSAECRFSIDTMMTFSWRDRPNISHCGCLPWFQPLAVQHNTAHMLKPFYRLK